MTSAISGSTGSPVFTVPAASCDSHIHIVDNRFAAADGSKPRNAPADAYQAVGKRMGTTRTVIVTPRPYVTDNRCTLDAIAQLGSAVTRGVAVLHPTVTDTELKKLDDGGIRGIRFTIGDPKVAVTTLDMVEPLAKRIKPLGWHVQLHWLGDQIVENAGLLQRLDLPIVIDHMGRLPPPDGIRHAAFDIIRRLLDSGRAWVKLSASELHDSSGRRIPTIAEMTETAQAFVRAAPERVVWGSDWPHGGEKSVPDDLDYTRLCLLGRWAGSEANLRRILVDNPEALYGFPRAV
jgi:D-galactarolactone isomerase